jgi:HAT1-interacting factor 1
MASSEEQVPGLSSIGEGQEQPSMDSINEETSAPESESEKRERLTNLIAKATAEYAVKHYAEASELYSQATEIQAELNGEMALENADLLYSYGKCLYFLAQQTSNVLGGTAASAQLSSNKKEKKGKKRKANGTGHTNGESSKGLIASAMDTVPSVGDVVPESDVKQESTSDNPFMQISGDAEGWDESDEDEEADEDGEAEEEDDDFATSYELLDLARVLYLKKLDQSQEHALEDSDKGKYVASIDLTPEVKSLKIRVADIYDLESEISLEGEKYSNAVTDLKACLALREELEPPESSILAECHYKLSLALEFAANDQQRDEQGNPTGELKVDWTVRKEAIAQQEKAIESCKLRVAKESKDLETLEQGQQKDKAMAQVEDVQDMISEMEIRLAELRKPPVSVKAESENEMKQQIQGVLGSLLGTSDAEKQEKLAQVSQQANDISGMVKRKKPKTQTNGGDSGFGSATSTPAAEGSGTTLGKRKVGFADEVQDNDGKKAKVEDTEDSGF